jgi:hypothetical protein
MGVCSGRTSEVLQELDFTQSALGQDLLAEDVCDLLDGHSFASLVVRGRAAQRNGYQHDIPVDRGEVTESYQTMP